MLAKLRNWLRQGPRRKVKDCLKRMCRKLTEIRGKVKNFLNGLWRELPKIVELALLLVWIYALLGLGRGAWSHAEALGTHATGRMLVATPPPDSAAQRDSAHGTTRRGDSNESEPDTPGAPGLSGSTAQPAPAQPGAAQQVSAPWPADPQQHLEMAIELFGLLALFLAVVGGAAYLWGIVEQRRMREEFEKQKTKLEQKLKEARQELENRLDERMSEHARRIREDVEKNVIHALRKGS
jgi:hypothetical protein